MVSGNGNAVIENGKTYITVNTENKNGVSQDLQLEAVTVTTPEEPKPEVKPETPKTLTLVDDASNVVITYTEGDLPENTTLSVSVNNNLVVDGLKNTVGYDITLRSDGSSVQPKNPVNVSIEPKKSLDRATLQVYHETKDGFESLAWVADGTRIAFDTASFSLFALGEKDVKVLPSTGVTPQNVLPFVGVLVVVGGCFILYGKRKNKK
ncbi:LPXTG cell wall anchor domain-containing protein [Erysipelothrix piscisicarius]|uniref:LPXTG cell wall anchor domain-containing protein n=1 Tax=Erysipelothrix piscisicarius TaxID=2485784 RepID=UPI002F958F9C